ncbi:MAG TPA: hypothetical protein VMW24_16955 [Sedimentisphaerales bacterium]|nr:hypothetical protein [Sedimentisphaerales bacterium]
MRTDIYVFLLACSVLLGGCSRTIQTQEPPVAEKETPPMVQVKNVTITDANLILDYRVSNPFDDDIRVLLDVSHEGDPYAVTRIDGEWVWIKLRCYHELELGGLADRPAYGEYLRLAPGESRTGRIVLDLPIKDDFRELEEVGRAHKQITLQRAVLEVGYFRPQYSRLFKGIASISRTMGDITKLRYPPANVVVAEQMQGGRSREITYIWGQWPELRLEESAKVLITGVSIPCSVVVEDK